MSAFPCISRAWSSHESELRGYLNHRLANLADTDDLLQEVYIKALRQGRKFCEIANPRAWLFQVARNALTDRLRMAHKHEPLLNDDMIESPPVQEIAPVDDLTQCLPRVLNELSEEDRLAITLCDMEGKSQQELADRLGITLSGAKSRIQRARNRLKKRLVDGCNVSFDEAGKICCFMPRSPE